MQIWLKMFGMPVASIAALAMIGAADAAESGRAAYNVNRLNRTGTAGVQRMPTMPTLPINTTGNMTQDLPTIPTNPDIPDVPDVPDVPNTPDEPTPECPDGGVKNSEYTVEKCMNDVYSCVNQSLPGGINDMFNEELRNSIVNGMGLCSVQVEKCITQVRRDCENIYHSAADVWLDFNARKVQPDYYAFVLRKTGLTPLQAENTCWLLDKNTYGASFDAVANSGVTTYEYNNRVGAYNGQGGVNIVKKNPQGATLNDGNLGVDGSRGHYARWDATTAECYLRVAAYNKDTPIKNSWLFGAVGDDRLAEAWERAGTTFTCNKDLFGFSLYKNTNTVAVVGIGGGTLLGAGIGALAGHGDRAFDCDVNKHRKELWEELKSGEKIFILNEYLDFELDANADNLSKDQCEAIVDLYYKYKQLKSAQQSCDVSNDIYLVEYSIDCINQTIVKTGTGKKIDKRIESQPDLQACYAKIDAQWSKITDEHGKEIFQFSPNLSTLCKDDDRFVSTEECAQRLSQNKDKIVKTEEGGGCNFKPFDLALQSGDDIYCKCDGDTCSNTCISAERLGQELEYVKFIERLSLDGDKNNRLKTTLVGAGIGAGAGGVATAITAFVEKNNINCRVGDGLERVSFGKSMTIGTLRDFYVKWNLRLPESVAPTAHAVDCNSWRRACSEITDLDQCKRAQINYKPSDAPAITLVHSACIPSGSVCIENYPVAKSYGACVPESKPDDGTDSGADKGAQE
ncbi:MAG: hypothetical protein NC311_09150 [Muribaculaceae bacterium]|nr:hypothetical protein [Muribaculaceae bacterium]